MIANLQLHHNNLPLTGKFTHYPTLSLPDLNVESWKINEFEYYEVLSQSLTLACRLSLFKERGDEPRYRVVARGYDKFFNIGEVPWTTMRVFLIYVSTRNLTLI